jgi:hypothetical protein
MSKRAVRKVRHYAPAPGIKDRVESGKSHEDGGDNIHLMEVWRSNVPRYQGKNAYLQVQKQSIADVG